MKSQIATTKPKPPADLYEQMDALHAQIVRGDEGMSAEEYSTRYKCGRTTARRHLEQLAAEGKLVIGYRSGKVGSKLKVFRPA